MQSDDAARSTIYTEIQALTQALAPRLIEIRRHLHTHPELSGQEIQTAAYVAGVLSSCGLHVREGMGQMGVIAEFDGTGDDGRHLAVRTDMDALPIQEKVVTEFTSRNPGVMHACGHDIHTTVGLGTVMVLSQLQAQIPGAMRFIFQSAEEISQGAHWMVRDGAMVGIDHILSLHVFPSIRSGKVGIRYGALTAAADDLELTIIGESGHGARPHEAIDAIWIAAQVMTALQQAISRTQNSLRPIVLTIGKIQGGHAPNIIADQVQLSGTVRSLHPETYAALPAWIEQIVAGVCSAYGAKYHLDYKRGVPSVQNDHQLMGLIEAAVLETGGKAAIELLHEPSLGAEDFAVYLNHAPGAMFRLGVGFPDRFNYPLHHPLFEPDEKAIVTGVVTMAAAAMQYWHSEAYRK
jgi:amidohydrolase